MEITGNPRPLHQAIESIRKTRSAALPIIASIWLQCALAERDPAAAAEALRALKGDGIGFGDEIRFNRAFLEGFIARLANNEEQAQLKFAAPRTEQQKIVPNTNKFLLLSARGGKARCACSSLLGQARD